MLFPWPDGYIALTLFAALLFASGNALQKQAVATRLAPIRASALLTRGRFIFSSLFRSPLWLLGLAVTIAAFAVEIQALARGDVTVVKPLSRVQVLFVLAIGVLVLRERLTRAERLGVGMIFAGASALASEPGNTRAGVPPTAASIAVAISCMTLVTASLWLTERRVGSVLRETAPALAAGAFFGLGDVLMKSATDAVRLGTGTFSLASIDTLTALAKLPELVLSVLATALAFIIQQVAFSRGRVSLVVPLVGVSGTAVVIILGVTLLHEHISGIRAVAVAAMVAGTILAGRKVANDASRGRPQSAGCHDSGFHRRVKP